MSAVKSIYTDGACSGNPGPGGWGVVIYFEDGSVHELGGRDQETTNNRMELQATIAGLEFLQTLPEQQAVPLYTDSQYVKNGITQWINRWKRKGWKTAKGQPVLNQDLWKQLDVLEDNAVDWRYVRGHSGDVGNERCDQIARAYATGKRPQLRQQFATRSLSSKPTAAAPTPTQLIAMPTETHDAATTENSVMPTDLTQLQTLMQRLRMADEIAERSYLLTGTELAMLTAQTLSESPEQPGKWRNWAVIRVMDDSSEEALWRLERKIGG